MNIHTRSTTAPCGLITSWTCREESDTPHLDAAYVANPAGFAARPTPPKLPTVAWINEPQEALIQNR